MGIDRIKFREPKDLRRRHGNNKEGNILISLMDEIISGDKLKGFLSFLFEQSNEIVLCQLGSKKRLVKQLNITYDIKKCEVTKKTHCTTGPQTTVFYFDNEENIRQSIYAMEELFTSIKLGENREVELEDPAFYKDGELICTICSHESMGYLQLSPVQYEEFKLLRIPHDTNRDKALSFEVWLDICAFQERTKLTIWGHHKAVIPENIGNLTHLKQLEIFDHEVVHLPKTLENLVNLECLRITGNQVEDLNFDIEKLKNLKVLDLSGMPLKVFPKGIVKLTQLEKLYLSNIEVTQVPETLSKLKNLKVVSLPKLNEAQYSKEFIEFVKSLEPKPIGIPLKEILGEEAWAEIEKADIKSIVQGIE